MRLLSNTELKDKIDDIDFILRCQNDFVYFVENVLGFGLAPFHVEQITEALSNRFVGIVNPRGHSKTTVYSVSYAIWRLWRERNYQICLISSSIDQSKKIMDIVQTILQTNPFLKSLCPSGRQYIWNRLEITTTNGNYYYVKPLNSTIRGIHPNLIICDDILRETDTPMSEIRDIFWSIIFVGLQTSKGQLIVVGTPQTRNDLFTDIEKRAEKGRNWTYIKRSAVVTDERGNWIEPIWKERFSLEELEDIKETMGPVRFSREYMVDPLSHGASLYKLEDIVACCDDDMSASGIGDPSKGPIFIGCDFAMSNAPSGDFSVFIVVQKLNEPHLRVKKTDEGIEYTEKVEDAVVLLHIDRFKGASFDTQIQKIIKLNELYHPQKVVVDSSNFGITYLQELQKRFIPVDGQMMPSNARNALLVNVCKFVEKNSNGSRRLVLPTNQEDGYVYTNVMKLVEELRAMQMTESRTTGISSFKSVIAHDDCVFGLALALRDVQRSRSMPKKLIYTAKVGDVV